MSSEKEKGEYDQTRSTEISNGKSLMNSRMDL